MNLNQRIEKIMEYSGYSASEFSDEIDVQRSNISHIISGRNKPSLEFVTKIKNRFPELNWDWIIYGTGEMVKLLFPIPKIENEISVENEKSIVPNLFTLIDDDNFGGTENKTTRELNISDQSSIQEKIFDSRRLEKKNTENNAQNTENQIIKNTENSLKVKKIVFFYENGKFESFEPN